MNPDFEPLTEHQIQVRITQCRNRANTDPEHAVEWTHRANIWAEILQQRIADGYYPSGEDT